MYRMRWAIYINGQLNNKYNEIRAQLFIQMVRHRG